ncbi:TPA: hypothetical protein ACXE8V_001117 [Pluralibacter gergoviae]
MTLLEILVKELPGKGGWPAGTDRAIQTEDTYIRFPDVGSYYDFLPNFTATDQKTAIITREQYEAALAESKKVAWDGDGLPPVGCECEWKDRTGWVTVTIKYLSEWVIVFSGLTPDGEEVEIAKNIYGDDVKFRPILSEGERKREESCDRIYGAMTSVEREGNRSDMAEAIYDAIAAGKIPHVKIV